MFNKNTLLLSCSQHKKILVLVTNLDVQQFLFPLKKIKFCDSRLASCILDLYLLIKIQYLINY